MSSKCWVLTTFRRHLVFDVLFYERQDCPLKGDSEGTINSLSSQKYLDTLKNMFVERSTQYTSFSPRKQPANAGTECKQFTENASVALQQPILTHAYTKCPPVVGGKPHLFKNFYQPLDLTLQKFTFHWIHLILGKYICWSHQQTFFAVMAGNLSIFFV